MPPDLADLADPRLLLLSWAAGLALVAAFVASTGVVGRGFTWLIGGASGLVGLVGVFREGAFWARLALVALVVGLMWARGGTIAGIPLTIAGLGYAIDGALLGGWLPAVTATLALGGVNGEMLLGHWYLVDPRLPRWTLRTLAGAGIVGLVADGVVLVTGGLPGGGATIAFWALLATSIVLMASVIAALRYPAYSGVMAATGLSYLAVLTTLGAVFLGRALVAGVGPFAT